VPANPPGLDDELPVLYRLPDWPEPRPGFVLVEPGLFRLRPRFSVTTGLVLRPAGAARLVDRFGIGSLAVGPDDFRWGVADGQEVLRVWPRDGEAGEPWPLEITSPEVEELRARLGRFAPPAV
jgi:hypothetical protein